MSTLLVDNYDSYTYNLFQLLAAVNGEPPLVVRNDQLTWPEFLALDVTNVVISPGPGRPEHERDFGICARILAEAVVPVLGVCLGHQGLGMVFGGAIVAAPEIMHGRIDAIYHDGADLFRGVPQGFDAVRYHSLVVAPDIPSSLQRTAWTADGVIMGLRHRHRPLWGVQFHPESICTQYGEQIMRNFRAITQEWHARQPYVQRSAPVTSGDATPGNLGASSQERQSPVLHYAVHVRRLDGTFDAEQMFVGLYGDNTNAFWLDSSRAEAGLSRFSFMGGCEGPHSRVLSYDVNQQVLTIHQDGVTTTERTSIFAYMRREAVQVRTDAPDLPFDFHGGFVGYWGYEMKAECGGANTHQATHADAQCFFADRMIVFDHLEGMTYLVCLDGNGDAADAETWFDATERRMRCLPTLPDLDAHTECNSADLPVCVYQPHQAYLDSIDACHAALRAGESYEICLTTQSEVALSIDPLMLYRHLRRVNPAPYAAFLRFDDMAVLSSSPERFLRIDRERRVEAKPIKGTARRGTTAEQDEVVKRALGRDEKIRAENMMIVDLLRNDLGMVCETGSVHVPKLMDVETYATVHQVVSTVRGVLRLDVDTLDCFRAAFPGGSMTGAPKRRTMEIIDQLEGTSRGVYSGALGWFGIGGSADLSVVIRTMVWTPDLVTFGAGGAITIQSDPEAEWEEMLLKAHPLLRALAACIAQESVIR